MSVELLDIEGFERKLANWSVTIKSFDDRISFSQDQKSFTILFSEKHELGEVSAGTSILSSATIKTYPEKIIALVLSRLKLNKIIYARSCTIHIIPKNTAAAFLDRYHIMNSTSSAFNRGLFYNDDLLCVASFSKGRKMNRLADDKRSFELIRFCTLPGITIAGGLSKLLRSFIREKKAGDIMTYVDKQFSDGSSFIKAGFKKHVGQAKTEQKNSSSKNLKENYSADSSKMKVILNTKLIFTAD